MSIKEKTEKVKEGIGEWQKRFAERERTWFMVCLVILVAFLAFGLGRLSKIEETREPIRIEKAYLDGQTAAIGLNGQVEKKEVGEESSGKTIVASKRGKKYHYVWCSGAKSIKEENKIFFTSEAEAENRGYTLAANCQK